jgi:GDPmannose 4,6-dehydratase
LLFLGIQEGFAHGEKVKGTKSALITGCKGQDGRYLTQYLIGRGYCVYGVGRTGLYKNSVLHGNLSINSEHEFFKFIKTIRPHEVYHLAGVHQSSERRSHSNGDKYIKEATRVHVTFLEKLAAFSVEENVDFRVLNAGSAHIFGEVDHCPQTEETPIQPNSAYGRTKAQGVLFCQGLQKSKKAFFSNAILFNHESPLRSNHYLLKKIASTAVRIGKKEETELVLGDLQSQVDIGFSGDFVVAMHQVLQLPEPSDFIIATGKSIRIKEWVEWAFQEVGLHWKNHVKVNKRLIKDQSRASLRGDITKIKSMTGWNPDLTGRDLMTYLINMEDHGSEKDLNLSSHL